MKMYFVTNTKEENKDMIQTFIDYVECGYHERHTEMDAENQDVLLGEFVKEYCTRDYEAEGLIPAIVFEDEEGNIIEYYVFCEGKKLEHWSNTDSYEMEVTKKAYPYIVDEGREDIEINDLYRMIIDNPFEIVDGLIHMIEDLVR